MTNARDESVRRHNLERMEPTNQWIEGIPTGNGLLGAMTWGGPREMIFTVGRSDLWLTTQGPRGALQKLDVLQQFSAGALVVDTGDGATSGGFREGLDLLEATAYRQTGAGSVQWLVHATRPVLAIRLAPTGSAVRFRWNPPALWDKRAGEGPDPYAGRMVADSQVADHAAMMTMTFDGHPMATIAVQVMQHGKPVAMTQSQGQFTAATQAGDEAMLLLTIGSQRLNPVPIMDNLRHVLLDCPDWSTLAGEHAAWWRQFWARGGMSLSHHAMDRLWHLGTYFLGAMMRQDSPPASLQGVWCEDGLVPWGNRLGWDLNIQATYSSIYTGNHLELGFSLYTWYRDHLPEMADFAKGMFGPKAEGAYLHPGTDDLAQTWVHDSCGGFGAGPWVAHHFWQHFLYTGDLSFLRDYCLPVFREHLKIQRFGWRKESDGQYHLLHRAQSPEIQHEATKDCPMVDTAYEIALARFLADAYIHTLHLLGDQPDDLAAWAKDFLAHVVPYPTMTNQAGFVAENPAVSEYFVEWPGLDTQLSHRHHSHLMMIFPLGEVHRFSSRDPLLRGRNALGRLIMRGTGMWNNFSFPWASLIATRVGGRREMPAFMLELADRCLPVPFNGLMTGTGMHDIGLVMHNDPATTISGTFTVEANMLAVTAVQDALLHGAGDHAVLAGGVPRRFDGEFWNLRSPFGDLVSGVIEQGKLVSTTLTAEREGVRRLAVEEPSSTWRSDGSDCASSVEAGHRIIQTTLQAGQVLNLCRQA
ncbi:MAG: hypothetical protein IT440_00485 [Phycisphaeraceae bacterium]|nr:hypothetical protein [Phycisphaeraceae bacterium]